MRKHKKKLLFFCRAKPMRGVFSSQRTKDACVCSWWYSGEREREREREKEREKNKVIFLGFHIF